MLDSKQKNNLFIIIILIIILIIIIYKLYYNDSQNNNYIEHFESILHKIKSKKIKKKVSNIFQNNENTTLDDLIEKSEKFTKKKDEYNLSIDSLMKYKDSFNHPKFKNNSKNTAESFEKFAFYKAKFLELFK